MITAPSRLGSPGSNSTDVLSQAPGVSRTISPAWSYWWIGLHPHARLEHEVAADLGQQRVTVVDPKAVVRALPEIGPGRGLDRETIGADVPALGRAVPAEPRVERRAGEPLVQPCACRHRPAPPFLAPATSRASSRAAAMGSAAAHTADTTAIPSAPAAITAAALPRSIPPIATMGSGGARPDGGEAHPAPWAVPRRPWSRWRRSARRPDSRPRRDRRPRAGPAR